jgi:hypothetical protein
MLIIISPDYKSRWIAGTICFFSLFDVFSLAVPLRTTIIRLAFVIIHSSTFARVLEFFLVLVTLHCFCCPFAVSICKEEDHSWSLYKVFFSCVDASRSTNRFHFRLRADNVHTTP